MASIRYDANPSIRVDGNSYDIQGDLLGNQLVSLATDISGEDRSAGLLGISTKPTVSSAYALTPVTSITSSGVVVKAAAGNLYTFYVTNNNSAIRYLQFHNSTTAPADSAVPFLAPIPMAPGATVSGTFMIPYAFSTGIYVCNSTTRATKTLGSADSDITVGAA